MRNITEQMQANSGITRVKLVLLGLTATCLSFAGFKLADSLTPGPLSRSVQVASLSEAERAPLFRAPDATRSTSNVLPAKRAKPTNPVKTAAEVPAATKPAAVVAAVTGATQLATVSPIEEVQHRIERGETISAVFESHGVGAMEAESWIRAADKVYDLDRIFEGQRLVLTINRANGALLGLQMEIDPETNLVARRKSATTVVATREAVSLDRTVKVATGRIMSSFYAAATEVGVPDKVISEVADVLGWDINFATDLRPGAEFRIVYEELERPGTTRRSSGRVLAVQLENRRRTHEGIWFENTDGSDGYYDRHGQSLGRDFLRYPVAFTRISSHYSQGRFHPVLKRNKPHYGVDFAAPPGTPIRSVADGRIEMAAWHGGNGRFVKIQHDEVFESGYSHLSKIATGIKKGGKVKKGQVIGYVGSSGLATGPHLHFSMYRSGDYINPLSSSMPRSRSLAGNDLASFQDRLESLDGVYAKAASSSEPLAMLAAAAGL
jgi:murein DD-endopeptidase MepM/ murein hydrolase activator NlpD